MLTREEITDLCDRIRAHSQHHGIPLEHPPMVGLFTAVCITLTYVRRTVSRQNLRKPTVSQSTISKCISAMTPLIAARLQPLTPTAEDLVRARSTSRTARWLRAGPGGRTPELYSGKHETTGLTLQVVCDMHRQLAWISDPVDGSWHDVAAVREHGVLDGLTPADWFGDQGYVGTGMHTRSRNRPVETCWSGREVSTGCAPR